MDFLLACRSKPGGPHRRLRSGVLTLHVLFFGYMYLDWGVGTCAFVFGTCTTAGLPRQSKMTAGADVPLRLVASLQRVLKLFVVGTRPSAATGPLSLTRLCDRLVVATKLDLVVIGPKTIFVATPFIDTPVAVSQMASVILSSATVVIALRFEPRRPSIIEYV